MQITEMFYSIQGEGVHMGKPTFFVRTAICNLRCSWCVPGEAVLETRGGQKRIDEIVPGDEVLAYSPSDQAVQFTSVEETTSRFSGGLLELWLESGHNLMVTSEHPLYTSQGWREAGALNIGDRVLVRDPQMGQSWARISDLESRLQDEQVYNLSCKPFQNYFVNDVLTHNCDTQYSWEKGEEMTVAEILRKVEAQKVRSVCLTGGEPLLWEDSGELIRNLTKRGYEVVVETSGSISLKGVPREGVCISMDIKCPSSGMEEKMEFDSIGLLGPGDQLKFIISDEKDYDYAKNILEKYNPQCHVVMQPEGGRRLLPLAQWVLRDGIQVRVLPQLHRLIWPETDRGI